jgi:hypothetical protein
VAEVEQSLQEGPPGRLHTPGDDKAGIQTEKFNHSRNGKGIYARSAVALPAVVAIVLLASRLATVAAVLLAVSSQLKNKTFMTSMVIEKKNQLSARLLCKRSGRNWQ